MTLYGDNSYDRQRYIRGATSKDEGELFNDSLQVSAIKNSGVNQFMDEGDDDNNLQEEDTSAKRLLPNEVLLTSKQILKHQ